LHLSTAHAEKWGEYQNIKTIKVKEVFFARAPITFGNTLNAHMESASHLPVVMSAKIVEDITADLLFHQDDIERVAQICAMALSK
jgi:hypothetical protein